MAGKIYYAATHPNFTGHMAKTKTTHSNGNGKANGKGDNGQGSKEGEGGEDKAGVNPTWCVLQYEDRTLDTVNKVLKVRGQVKAHEKRGDEKMRGEGTALWERS
jgi:hypothetical protein